MSYAGTWGDAFTQWALTRRMRSQRVGASSANPVAMVSGICNSPPGSSVMARGSNHHSRMLSRDRIELCGRGGSSQYWHKDPGVREGVMTGILVDRV